MDSISHPPTRATRFARRALLAVALPLMASGCGQLQGSAAGADASLWCPSSQIRERDGEWVCNSGFVSSNWNAACAGGQGGNVKQTQYATGQGAGYCPAGTAFAGDSVTQFNRAAK